MERHRHDYEWQVWRGILATAGAVVFVMAGSKMRSIESISGDSIAEAFYEAMGLFAYGMAVLCLLVGLPGRLLADPEPSAPDAGAEPAASGAP